MFRLPKPILLKLKAWCNINSRLLSENQRKVDPEGQTLAWTRTSSSQWPIWLSLRRNFRREWERRFGRRTTSRCRNNIWDLIERSKTQRAVLGLHRKDARMASSWYRKILKDHMMFQEYRCSNLVVIQSAAQLVVRKDHTFIQSPKKASIGQRTTSCQTSAWIEIYKVLLKISQLLKALSDTDGTLWVLISTKRNSGTELKMLTMTSRQN